MMTAEQNERLTRVGSGTPMGELLRRYWTPVAISSQIGQRPVLRRILGEDLVVFRDGSGKVGVVERHCAHRRADLSVGVCEKNGIRCGYHGWLYGHDGRIIEQPAEPQLNTRVQIKAYPARELAGLIFAYMGPEPVPLLPNFDLFVWDGVLRDIGECRLDFNWLQAMENSVDPHHAEWLHGHFMNYWRRTEGSTQAQVLTKKHLKVGFDTFEYGIVKRRVLEGHTEADDDWKIGHPLIFPIMLKVGGGGIEQFQIRVPIDDVSTWHIWYTTYRPTAKPIPQQNEIPAFDVPLFDEKGNRILDFIDGQDIAVWAGQGVIADRTKETISSSDRGIVLFRNMLKEQLAKVEAGEDPMGVVRDPAKNVCIDFPIEQEKYGGAGPYVKELLNFQAIRHSPMKEELLDLFGVAD